MGRKYHGFGKSHQSSSIPLYMFENSLPRSNLKITSMKKTLLYPSYYFAKTIILTSWHYWGRYKKIILKHIHLAKCLIHFLYDSNFSKRLSQILKQHFQPIPLYANYKYCFYFQKEMPKNTHHTVYNFRLNNLKELKGTAQ